MNRIELIIVSSRSGIILMSDKTGNISDRVFDSIKEMMEYLEWAYKADILTNKDLIDAKDEYSKQILKLAIDRHKIATDSRPIGAHWLEAIEKCVTEIQYAIWFITYDVNTLDRCKLIGLNCPADWQYVENLLK